MRQGQSKIAANAIRILEEGMKWMCCLFLGIALAIPALAQNQAACERAVANWKIPASIPYNNDYGITSPDMTWNSTPIPLVSGNGLEVYGMVEGSEPYARYWLITIFQGEQARQEIVQKLMNEDLKANPLLRPDYAAALKISVAQVVLMNNADSQTHGKQCSGIQCKEEPFAYPSLRSFSFYIPPQCVGVSNRDAQLGSFDGGGKLNPFYSNAFYKMLKVSFDNSQAQIQDTIKQAQKGNANAESTLGIWYRDGSHGLTKNLAQSIIWFRKAAELGDAEAQFTLGTMYSRGEGVPPDDAKAYFWFDVALMETENGLRASGIYEGDWNLTGNYETFSLYTSRAAAKLTPRQVSEEGAEATRWLAQHR